MPNKLIDIFRDFFSYHNIFLFYSQSLFLWANLAGYEIFKAIFLLFVIPTTSGLLIVGSSQKVEKVKPQTRDLGKEVKNCLVGALLITVQNLFIYY